jgi:glycolate oxidase FAD binding subunit
MDSLTPDSFESAAGGLAAAVAAGRAVRFRGGATKLSWGQPIEPPPVELSLARLDATLEHNAGDLTAIFQAGVPLERAQRELAAAGQRLALDPPLAAGRRPPAATFGGIFATGDSGPLRHRYGGPRDLILGITVALSDGTIARAGGKVIKNVAGYDLAKLFTGSFGTLGLILSVSVRLHPLPVATATALGSSDDAATVAGAARALAAAPLELEALDVAWRSGRGGLLAQCAGAQAARRARRAAELMRSHGLAGVDVAEEDGPLWDRQRAGQRSASGALVRVASPPSRLPALLAAADAGAGTLVGRAGLGLAYVELEPDAVERLYAALPAGVHAQLLDAPAPVRARIDPFGTPPAPALELMRRIKRRFDPPRACNPGVFVGAI